MIFIKYLIRNLVYKILYKNYKLYFFLINISVYFNFLLPHEEQIHGFEKFNFKNRDNLIDIGGGNGLFVKSIRRVGFIGNIISIDPLKENYENFKKIIRVDNKVRFINKVVSQNKTLKLFTPIYCSKKLNNWTSHSKKEIYQNLKNAKFNLDKKKLKFEVKKYKTIKLDNIIKNKVSVIKLDIEGSELDAIKSGMKTIKKFKPIIYLESNLRKDKKETNMFKVGKILSKFGYKCYLFDAKKNKFKINKDYHNENVFFLRKQNLNNI